jgi:hypothetical protein
VFYAFLLGIAAIGGIIYLFIAGLVPGLKEERFGVLEPLPKELGKWQEESESEAGRRALEAGKKLEVRLSFEEGGLFSAGKLVRQARLRDATSNVIVEVLPEETIKRKRVRQTA